MTLKPLFDRVVIRNIETEEITKGGILLTSSAKEKPQMAEVIAVGPGGNAEGKETEMADVRHGRGADGPRGGCRGGWCR